MKNFAENLSRILKEKNISQLKLATDLNLAAPSVSRYCTGLQLPRADVVTEIANYLQITTDELLGVNDTTEDSYNKTQKNLYESFAHEYLKDPKNMTTVLLNKLSDEELKQVLDFVYFLLSKHKEYQDIPNTKDTP